MQSITLMLLLTGIDLFVHSQSILDSWVVTKLKANPKVCDM